MSIRKQTIINTVGSIVYFIALWLLTVITTRIQGLEAAGILTLAMAIGSMISMGQNYGVRGYQSSDMSFKYSSKDYLVSRIITDSIGLVLGIGLCFFLNYSFQVSLAIIFFTLLKTSESFSDVLFGNDQRMGRLEVAGFSMFARGILIIVLFVVGVSILKNLNSALLIAAIGAILLSICFDLPVHNRITKRINGQNNGAKGILIECFPLFLASMIPMVITAVPRIVLEKYSGAEVLGAYGNVSTPALLLTTVIPVILTALLPGYGIAVKKQDYRSIRRQWMKTIIGTISITVVCLIVVRLIGKAVLTFVYSNQILPYVNYLYYVFIAMMFYAVTMCNQTVLVSVRKTWGISITALIALALCVGVSLLTVRYWGIIGAIVSLGIPYAIQSIIQIIWILRICSKYKGEG